MHNVLVCLVSQCGSGKEGLGFRERSFVLSTAAVVAVQNPRRCPSLCLNYPPPHRTAGDGVIDSNDGVDTNGDGVIDSQDGATAISTTPAPLSDADAEASGNGAMSAVNLPAGSVYAGVVGVAMTVGGMLLL